MLSIRAALVFGSRQSRLTWAAGTSTNDLSIPDREFSAIFTSHHSQALGYTSSVLINWAS